MSKKRQKTKLQTTRECLFSKFAFPINNLKLNFCQQNTKIKITENLRIIFIKEKMHIVF